MVKAHDNDIAGELVDVVEPAPDPLRPVFAALIGEVMKLLPNDFVRRIVIERLMQAHTDALAALRRRASN